MTSVKEELARDHQNRLQLLQAEAMLLPKLLAQTIDATILAASATRSDIASLVQKAETFRVRAVCVPQAYLALEGVRDLPGKGIAVATVINFPLGHNAAAAVLSELDVARSLGAGEIDFVQPLWAVKSGDWRAVEELSKAIRAASPDLVTKVILETALLSPEEITECTRRHAAAGINIIKTSTGFAPSGATERDVAAIRAALESLGLAGEVGIKASGGITTQAAAMGLIRAGATRVGTSRTEQILQAAGAA